MKSTITSLLLSLTLITLGLGQSMDNGHNDGGERLVFDTKSSKIEWLATKVTGEHYGFVGLKEGWVHIQDNKIHSGQLVLDLNNIIVTDIESPEWNQKLVDHLKSDDFFGVEKYPKAVFDLVRAESVKKTKDGDPNMLLHGKMTIKGISNDITIPANIHWHGKSGHATGEVKLDRTLWNIRYGSGKFFENLGDKMIHDHFIIKFNVTAKA